MAPALARHLVWPPVPLIELLSTFLLSNARLQLRHLAINTHVLVGLAIGWCSLCRPDSVQSVSLDRKSR